MGQAVLPCFQFPRRVKRVTFDGFFFTNSEGQLENRGFKHVKSFGGLLRPNQKVTQPFFLFKCNGPTQQREIKFLQLFVPSNTKKKKTVWWLVARTYVLGLVTRWSLVLAADLKQSGHSAVPAQHVLDLLGYYPRASPRFHIPKTGRKQNSQIALTPFNIEWLFQRLSLHSWYLYIDPDPPLPSIHQLIHARET